MNDKLYVLAGYRIEYLAFIKARKLEDEVDAVYLSHPLKLMGLCSPRIVFTGTYAHRKDINSVMDFIRSLQGTPYEARVEYHPIA